VVCSLQVLCLTFLNISHLFHEYYMPWPSDLWFHHPNNIWWRLLIMKLIMRKYYILALYCVCKISFHSSITIGNMCLYVLLWWRNKIKKNLHYAIFSILLTLSLSLVQIFSSNAISLFLSHITRDQVSHPYSYSHSIIYWRVCRETSLKVRKCRPYEENEPWWRKQMCMSL
jgi:hypothetical protein